ncbi:hypothetical protein, partial [Coprococcus comes]|uniref:hypothetical protein n=1 Tax=Coprococcus comes TaxID=410072 RepID=UPI001A9A3EFE
LTPASVIQLRWTHRIENATCCKNLSQGGFKMEIHKDFYFEAVLNDYLRKDNMDVFVTGRSS